MGRVIRGNLQMGFMMANFYLINWPDEDIKRISWEAIRRSIARACLGPP